LLECLLLELGVLVLVRLPLCFLFQRGAWYGSLITAGAGVGASTTAGVGAITGASAPTGAAVGLACLQFVILKLQFDPLSLDIYHPLVGLVVGLVAVWVLIAWLLCRPNFFVAASSWVVSS
jgi:hypothetical protein